MNFNYKVTQNFPVQKPDLYFGHVQEEKIKGSTPPQGLEWTVAV